MSNFAPFLAKKDIMTHGTFATRAYCVFTSFVPYAGWYNTNEITLSMLYSDAEHNNHSSFDIDLQVKVDVCTLSFIKHKKI